MKTPALKLIPTALCIWSMTLSQALPEYDPMLGMEITAANGKKVIVKGPKITYQDGQPYYDWQVKAIEAAPNNKFTVVHYIGTHPKYWDAHVYVVSPEGEVSELKNSMVRSIVWTGDGKYLMGFGDNTIRVWNMNGGVHQITLDRIYYTGYQQGKLCVEGPNLVRVYSIPSLKVLASSSETSVIQCVR